MAQKQKKIIKFNEELHYIVLRSCLLLYFSMISEASRKSVIFTEEVKLYLMEIINPTLCHLPDIKWWWKQVLWVRQCLWISDLRRFEGLDFLILEDKDNSPFETHWTTHQRTPVYITEDLHLQKLRREKLRLSSRLLLSTTTYYISHNNTALINTMFVWLCIIDTITWTAK